MSRAQISRWFTPRTLLQSSMIMFFLGLWCAPTNAQDALPSISEARVRAQLLHAAIHGSLRVMHRDFFHKGDSKAIPSESLKDVFKAMEEEWHVSIRWLASDETVMNADNKAKDEFQRKALAAVKNGDKEMTAVENGIFRYAGVIPLQNQCLKCHAPDRKSLEDRFAALEISMRVSGGEAAK